LKYDLFLDCDYDDKPVADMIYAALAVGGVDCYYPRWFRIKSRSGYGQFVRDELEDSRLLIVIFSRNAARPDSFGNIFFDHVEMALHHRKHVIAVGLDDAPVPMKFSDDHPLMHWVDVSTDAVEGALGSLVELARELLGGQAGSMEDEVSELLVESAASLTESSRVEEVLALYSPLVTTVATKIANRGDAPDIEKLTGEGIVGLMKAIRDFKPRQGVRFRSYAEKCIQQEIMMAIRWFPR